MTTEKQQAVTEVLQAVAKLLAVTQSEMGTYRLVDYNSSGNHLLIDGCIAFDAVAVMEMGLREAGYLIWQSDAVKQRFARLAMGLK